MPEDTKAKKPSGSGEGANTPEMPDPLDLTDKADIEGETVLVHSWRENPSRFTDPKTNAPSPPYLIYDATVLSGKAKGQDVTFSGGQVMDDQARKMNEPFRATVKKAKGKRYWQFRKPGT